MYKKITDFVHDLFGSEDLIPLHVPHFSGNEKKYLNDCIDSTFVSYVGEYVTRFESHLAEFTGIPYAAAVVNGTAALHTALLLVGVQPGEEVITQALTFVATVNAVKYCAAEPVFVDVDRITMGMSAQDLEDFLRVNAEVKKDGRCYNRVSGRRIAACMPMHTFGHPVHLNEIMEICERYHLPLVEDAAESLGSFYQGRHTGMFGRVAALSFNGNKTVTTGGGGAILSTDEDIIKRARHLTTTAKIPHKWEFVHDHIGYNYRMPNINAAVGCAQMEVLPAYLQNKRELAGIYRDFFKSLDMDLFMEPPGCSSNYWLQALVLKDETQKQEFLEFTNAQGVMTRPIWRLMTSLDMYRTCQATRLETSLWFEQRVVNLPSSVRL